MKLLFYRYGSICEPDIMEAFEELGLTVCQMTTEIQHKQVTAKECILEVSHFLMEHPVDFVFSINFYPALSEVCNIFHIRYLCWIVDSPVMELFTTSIQNPWNRVFLFDKSIYKEIAPYNPDCIFYLPLATNVRQKDQLFAATSPDSLRNYPSDICFIGSLYTEKCAYDRLPADVPPYLIGYLNGLMAAQLQIYGYYFIDEALPDSIVSDFATHFPGFYRLPGNSFLTDRITLSQLYIGNKLTALERSMILPELSKHFPVTIYTGSDTTAFPLLRNRGLAKTLTEMPLIFHETGINLNITARSIRSGLPLRIWDILGSGGFCLTNYQPELPELLIPGEHLDSYSSFDELSEKLSFYQSHPNTAREIAVAGYEAVKAHHTYPIRLAQMIETAYAMPSNERTDT